MIVVLNFLPLRTGGGVQVALDFLSNLKAYGKAHEWHLVCREGTPFRDAAKGSVGSIREVRDSLLARMFFEIVESRNYLRNVRPDVVYTQFGPQWPFVRTVQVVGCAYSNLFYPEVDFWGDLPYHKKGIKKIIDWYRLRKISTADVRIFETDDLAARAIRQCGFPEISVKVVRPAASSLVFADSETNAIHESLSNIQNDFKIVSISGFHPNKNIPLLLEALKYYNELYPGNPGALLLTLDKNAHTTREIWELAKSLKVEFSVVNLGTIPQKSCGELYKVADAAVLASNLESFSNMIAESWATGTPLLIADHSWSRDICGEAAIYFSPMDPKDLAKKMSMLHRDKELRKKISENGRARLREYPTSAERFNAYLQIIEEAPSLKHREN